MFLDQVGLVANPQHDVAHETKGSQEMRRPWVQTPSMFARRHRIGRVHDIPPFTVVYGIDTFELTEGILSTFAFPLRQNAICMPQMFAICLHLEHVLLPSHESP